MAAGYLDVGRMVATLGLNTAPFVAGAKGAAATLQRLNVGMMMAGRAMTRFISLPMAIAGGAAVSMQKDFESSMTKIISLVGVARGTVEEWAESVKEIAVTTGRGPEELADALFFIASAGIRGQEALNVLEMSAKGAAVGLGETKVIADLVTSAMNAYGKENLSAAQAVDVLVAAVREGKAEADELAGAMGMTLPIASEYNVSFAQVGATFAAMTRTGTNARIAATQLRAILAEMAAPAEETKSALAAVGYSTEQFRKAVEEKGLIGALLELKAATAGTEEGMAAIFGNIRALMGVLDVLGKNLESNVKIFESLEGATGSLEAAFLEAAKTTEFKLNVAAAALRVLFIDIGESISGPLITALSGLIGKVENLIEWFNKFNDAQKLTILRMAGLTAAMGPVLVLLSRIGQIVSTGIFAPLIVGIGLATTAIVGLTSIRKNETEGIRDLGKFNDQLKDKLADQRDEVNRLVSVIEDENGENNIRKKAIQDLNRILPEYRGYLTDEGDLINHNTKEIKKYVEALRVRTEQQMYEQNINVLMNERMALLTKERKILKDYESDVVAMGDIGEKVTFPTEKVVELRTEIDELTASIDELVANAPDLTFELPEVEEEEEDGSKDKIKNLGYLAQLQKDIKDAQEAALGATKEELAARLDDVEAAKRAYELALLRSNKLGEIGKLQREIQEAQIDINDLSGDELRDRLELIRLKQQEIDRIKAEVGGLGEIEELELKIAEVEILRANASGANVAKLNEQLRVLKEQKEVLSEKGIWDDTEPIDNNLKAWEDYYAKKLELARKDLAAGAMTQREYNRIVAESVVKLRDIRVQAAQDWLNVTSRAVSSISSLIEAQKQKELSAVGDNAKARERIEREYHKKQKVWAISEAIIHGALAITNLLANVPGSVINPATWAAIGVAAASTAVQVGVIAAQSFAQGGLVYGEMLAKVGDYPGAKSNPEIIAPLDTLEKFLSPKRADIPKVITLRAEGRDLVATINSEMLIRNTY